MIKKIPLDSTTDQIEGILEDAFECFEQGKTKQGKYLVKKIAKKYPKHYLSHYGLGLRAGFAGKVNLAIKHFKRSIEIDPTYGLAHFNLAVAYQKTKDVDLVIIHCHIALQVASQDELPMMEMAINVIKNVENNLPDGVTLEEYIESIGEFKIGFICMTNQLTEEAITSFERVLQIIPDHVQANGNLGICYMTLKDYKRARAYLNRAIELDLDYAPAINNLYTLAGLESGEIKQVPKVLETHYYMDKRD